MAGAVDLLHPAVPERLRVLLVAALRDDKRDDVADGYADAILIEMQKAGTANGHDRSDVLLAAAKYADEHREADRKASAASPVTETFGGLISICAADVTMRPIHWLWPGRIARGKVTLIAGDPGLGKTQLTMSLLSIVTAGGCWPVSGERCKPGDALLLSAEDDPEDTLVPRAKAAGADLRRLHIVQAVRDVDRDGKPRRRAANLADDLTAIELKLFDLHAPAVIVIDPVSAYLGRADSHNNAEVRALLAPVSELAARHRVAVVCVSHLNKSTGPKALQRVVGSIAFTAAARAAYLVAREAEDSPRRVLVPLKNNLGTDTGGFAFTIEPCDLGGGIVTSRVQWAAESVSVTADDLLNAASKPAEGSALDDACGWLQEVLRHGEVASQQIKAKAAGEGLAWRTVERARDALGVRVRKEGGRGGRWLWSIEDQDALFGKSAKTANKAKKAKDSQDRQGKEGG